MFHSTYSTVLLCILYIQVAGILRNLMKGHVSAKVLTDVWPDFSVIVCQVFHPRISEVSQTIVNDIATFTVIGLAYPL